MPLSTFHQHQGLPCLLELSHHLNIAVQLLKGEFATIQYFVGSLNHLLEGWDFLIEDIDQERYILLRDVLLVVNVDLLPPEFLEPHLLLHFVLKDSELGRNAWH